VSRGLGPTGLVLAAIVGVHLALAPWAPALALRSAGNGLGAFREVLLILPAVLVLIALFDAWAPREFIQRNLGPGSGLRGLALALLLGTAAAGPIYAAFPAGLALHRKGARTANVVLFLGAWATIKIPMLLLEGAFLGLRFALLRLALTLPGLVACGFLMERLEWGPASAAPPAPGAP
jgi:uncharacterized membrane protein YraQ (UPF0718 family)